MKCDWKVQVINGTDILISILSIDFPVYWAKILEIVKSVFR